MGEIDLTPNRLRVVPPLLALVLLAVVAGAGSAANPGPPGFPLDDAWIHLVYGRGLLANGFLAYQDGAPTTGATSPVWAVLLALAHAAAGDGGGPARVVTIVHVLGALIHLLVVLVAGRLARRLSASETTGLVAGGLVALATPLTAAAFSGMEVGLAALLLLLGVESAARGSWGRAGVWLALAGGTRPEAGLVVLVLAATAVTTPPGRSRPGSTLLRLLIGPLALGAALVAYDLWASGSPLPASFYAKSSLSLASLPGRAGRAIAGILSQVPPWGGGLGWFALAGLVPRLAARGRARGRSASGTPGGRAAMWPGLAAMAFLFANLMLIDPVDPAAFYHVRYLLPAVPLLLVVLALGADRLGPLFPGRGRAAPLAILAALSLLGAARSALPVSRHLHNDVRNINEVQRRIGEWLGASLPAGTLIATSDAGAVRYFSRLPTIDVTGLNTPAMRRPSEEFLREHPVCAVVLLPAWYRGPGELLEEAYRATTDRYSVTSNPRMALQVVLRLRGEEPRRVRFVGFHAFALDMVPWPGGS